MASAAPHSMCCRNHGTSSSLMSPRVTRSSKHAADGVVRYLAGPARGSPPPAGPVPIVPGAVVYDLATGDPLAPDAAAGEAACRAAVPIEDLPRGSVGAGTGATTG